MEPPNAGSWGSHVTGTAGGNELTHEEERVVSCSKVSRDSPRPACIHGPCDAPFCGVSTTDIWYLSSLSLPSTATACLRSISWLSRSRISEPRPSCRRRITHIAWGMPNNAGRPHPWMIPGNPFRLIGETANHVAPVIPGCPRGLTLPAILGQPFSNLSGIPHR